MQQPIVLVSFLSNPVYIYFEWISKYHFSSEDILLFNPILIMAEVVKAHYHMKFSKADDGQLNLILVYIISIGDTTEIHIFIK